MKNDIFPNFFEQRRFCFWKAVTQKNSLKPLKVPYYFWGDQLQPLDIRREEFWLTGYEAISILATKAEDVNGIGFILINSNLFVLDLDDCYDSHTNQLSEATQEIVDYFQNTYIEISPSGNRLHIIGVGKLNLNGRNKSLVNKHIEAYDGSSVRYMTFTNSSFNNVKSTYEYDLNHESIQWFQNKFFPKSTFSYSLSFTNSLNIKLIDNLISKIQNSKHKKVFEELCQGIKIKQSPSEDDLFFCSLAMRYLQKENIIAQKEVLKQILLKYRYRSKLHRSDYLNRTANKIVENFNVSLQKKIEIQSNTLTPVSNLTVLSSHLKLAIG